MRRPAHRGRRMRGDRIREPAIERVGRRRAGSTPRGIDHRLHQPVEALRRCRPDTATIGTPLHLRQPVVGLLAQLLAAPACALDQVPLVHADHERPALALHQIGDAQVLLLERALAHPSARSRLRRSGSH